MVNLKDLDDVEQITPNTVPGGFYAMFKNILSVDYNYVINVDELTDLKCGQILRLRNIDVLFFYINNDNY